MRQGFCSSNGHFHRIFDPSNFCLRETSSLNSLFFQQPHQFRCTWTIYFSSQFYLHGCELLTTPSEDEVVIKFTRISYKRVYKPQAITKAPNIRWFLLDWFFFTLVLNLPCGKPSVIIGSALIGPQLASHLSSLFK